MKETLELIKLKCQKLGVDDIELTDLIDSLEEKIELYANIEKCLYDSELYLVYKHTDPNGKVYIGITQNHPQTRWHEGGGYEKQSKFYRAIQKYGWINFKHEILAAGLTEEEARQLENQLIIENKSYDENFGYNTRVSIVTEKKSVSEPLPKKTELPLEKPSVEISKELIDKYGIKCIGGIVYYKENGYMISEKTRPLIQKVLLEEYNIPLRKHKEIIKQIEILSVVDENSLSQDEFQQIFSQDTIDKWMMSKGIQLPDILKTASTELYADYVQWAKTAQIDNVKGKKQFFKYIMDKYNLDKKQRGDGKRYFTVK